MFTPVSHCLPSENTEQFSSKRTVFRTSYLSGGASVYLYLADTEKQELFDGDEVLDSSE